MNAMRHAWAFDPWAAWIALELGEEPEFPDRVAAWCCADIFHPGPGQVIAIDGAEWAANHPDTREFQLKVQPGDVISRREGLGQNTGYLLFASASPGARLELYRQLRRQFAIQVRH